MDSVVGRKVEAECQAMADSVDDAKWPHPLGPELGFVDRRESVPVLQRYVGEPGGKVRVNMATVVTAAHCRLRDFNCLRRIAPRSLPGLRDVDSGASIGSREIEGKSQSL